jgi:hypothetical protein
LNVRFYKLRRILKTYVNCCSVANAIRGAAMRMAAGAINLTILKQIVLGYKKLRGRGV